MPDDIPPIPAIPPALREAAQLTKLIPFVGAGASPFAGCPDWNECANAALKVFVDQGTFSDAQLDRIKGLTPRVKLSIALALQAEHLCRSFQDRIAAHQLALDATFVTVNVDHMTAVPSFRSRTGQR